MATLPNLAGTSGGGGGPYGKVPGQIPAPRSTYSQVTDIAPMLPKLTDTASSVIGSELEGNISPGTQNFLQQKAAQFGVSLGMPGMQPGSFNTHNLVRSLGLMSEDLSRQGVQDFGGFLGSLAPTQISPELQQERSLQNSIFAAAPDPAQAANRQLQILKDLYHMGNAAGGTGDLASPWARAPEVETSYIPAKPGIGGGGGF